MAEQGHTKGPWEVNGTAIETVEDHPATQIASICDDFDDGREAFANARLLAAAPSLLEALQAMLADPHGCPFCDSGKLRNEKKGHMPDCPYVLARAAIKKALGEK